MLTALEPLRNRTYRMLWLTWLIANVSMWMNDVAAAWMMTSLTSTPLWVALVQTASTLPVLLLGLPSGALADGVDKKRHLMATQLWVALVAVFLSLFVYFGAMTPPLLLALTFANGIGLAMRWPVFSAIVPELVPRAQLPAALALNGVSINASRIIGPLVAGAVIAGFGSAWVFLLNAMMSVVAAMLILRWKREHIPNPLGREPLLGAMRVGLRYVMHSYHLKGVLVRTSIFFFNSTALMALLALRARAMEGGGAGTFTALLASMGMGAIAATTVLPRIRPHYSRDAMVLRAVALQGAAMLTMAFTNHLWIAIPAMFLAGSAWISNANTLSVSIQLGLPDWVRARGMSIYQMAIMGSTAIGAAFWGQMATWTSIPLTLSVAGIMGFSVMLLASRSWPDSGVAEDLRPEKGRAAPVLDGLPGNGRVLVTIGYQIDPQRAQEFKTLMQGEVRRSRLRHGAISWDLQQDPEHPGSFLESIVDASWTDHLRRFGRMTVAEGQLRERRLAFHVGPSAPVVTRRLMEGYVSLR